jgi:hypothetical protein
MDTIREEFWWNQITGPNAIVINVATALLDNKMVMLRVPSDLPWRHAMRSAIHNTFQVKSEEREVIIDSIDVNDDNPEQLEPGKFILNKFASSTISKGYREKSKTTIQKYISVKNVIKNHIIWVKGLDKRDSGSWIKFCKGFSGRSVNEGLFVLEIQEDVAVFGTNTMQVINFSDYVTSYDVQLFISFILNP